MKLHSMLLPAAVLAGAAFLLCPRESHGFVTNGSTLSQSQRDARLFDNFSDPTANENTTPDTNFPGYTGAEMAFWKACIEWGSELHGNGNGDPHQNGGLGSGGANFDPSWQGNATGSGTSNENIASQLSGDGGSTYAFAELPSSDGWRIRFYEMPWTWNDGPGSTIPGGHVDLQGIATHEYGHVVGLGHSTAGGNPTMVASTAPPAIFQRSISADDISGVQAVYGVKLGTKPKITNTSVVGTLLTITGVNFSATGNQVWFTQKAQGGTGTPIKVTNLSSSGTMITVTVPANAGPGDVLVRNNGTGNANLSNAWPVDVTGTGGGTGPNITGLSPSTIDAVAPDGHVLVLTGTGFNAVNSVTLDGLNLSTSTYVISGDTTITITLPYQAKLGDLVLAVTSPAGTDTTTLSIAACHPPVVDVKDSCPFVNFNFSGLTVTTGSEGGDIVFLYSSPDNVPSVIPGLIDFGIGNNFASLILLKVLIVDPVKGWVQWSSGPLALAPATTFYVQAATFPDETGLNLAEASNVQCVVVAF